MTALLLFILVWLSVLTVITLYQTITLKGLFKGSGRGLDHKINEVFGGHEKIMSEINQIQEKLQKETQHGETHFSHIGIVRFNPFERLGGEQSYCVALLNNQKSGVVITFLYTREGVRVYCKELQNGKGTEGDLSQEEKKAIVKAGAL